jgi:predicted transposase/invertase (TIGR01784 family)
MQLIVGFFETYVRLNEDEETNLETQILQLHPKEEKQIVELYTSWELKGMQKGMEKGMEQGVKKGLQTGERLAKLEMARKLLSEGLVSIDKIIEITGLTKEEIEQH